MYYVTPGTVSLANVGAALLQTLVEGVAVQLTDVTVLLVLLKIRNNDSRLNLLIRKQKPVKSVNYTVDANRSFN